MDTIPPRTYNNSNFPEGLPAVSLSDEERARQQRWTPLRVTIWILISAIAGLGWWMLAVRRGETVNGIWFVFAAIGSYFIGYRFYAKYIQDKLVHPDDSRATPAEYDCNGRDFVPTDRRILYGHHFAAIAGAGPLVGPVLSAQMGYLPSTIWIIVGVILAGAVQDYLVLVISMRRGGRSLGQMAREELGRFGGIAALIATLTIMLIIVAILAMVVVNSLAASSWGVWSVGLTIPIALLMGFYLRYLRPGKVLEVSIIGIVLLVLAIASGTWIENTAVASALHLSKPFLAWAIIIYGFIAAVLPVWMLLAPRDYLSTFMKVGVIAMLAISIVIVRPVISVPAMTVYATNGAGPVFSGKLFPFLFVTIACGTLSGFHATISSGTTPKLIEKESQARLIGYGGMLMESFVAIMALVAALSVDRGIYFAMNSPAGATGNTVKSAVAYVNSLGLSGVHANANTLTTTAKLVGETSIVSRTGGAPTLAVGLATIMHKIFGGEAMMSFWYHFAIMVAGWGSILLMGVTDPLGGINTLFPLFGIANQLLAAVALSICLVIFARAGHTWRLLIIFVPMLFTAIITVYGSWLKIFSPDPKLGYWANHMTYKRAIADDKTSLGQAKNIDEMHTVVGNTAIQGTMSIIFVVCALIVMMVACIRTVQALRGHNIIDTEDPAKPSKIFAPSGLMPTKAERDLQVEWDAFYEKHPELDLESVHKDKEHA